MPLRAFASVQASEVVFTSLPGPRQVDEVALAATGMYAGDAEGTIHVDLSSNSLSAVKRLAGLAAQQGTGFLDAPVSGGTAGAEAAMLSVVAGGDKATFDAVKPYFALIGQNVFHLGEVGAGTVHKLTNNVLALGASVLLQEVLTLGVKSGLRREAVALGVERIERARAGSADAERGAPNFSPIAHRRSLTANG